MTGDSAQFYEKLYDGTSLTRIRRYPNDEMMRFLGRHFFKYGPDDTFFHFSRPERASVRILEVGCGAGSNLWAIAKEGFSAYGLDAAPGAIELCRKMLDMWSVAADLRVGDLQKLPYEDTYFDAIVDVYTSFCLKQDGFERFLSEVRRTLKPGGKFFCWNPSAKSEAFTNHQPAKLIEPYTLDGIRRETSPFFGNAYPIRFLTPETVRADFGAHGLRILELECNGRSYRQTSEYFEWFSVTAERVQDEREIERA